MNKRDFITLLGSAAAAWPLGAPAQSTMPVIGYLHARGPDDAGWVVPCCRQGHRSRRPRGRRSLHHRRPPRSGTPTHGYEPTRKAMADIR